MVFKAMKYIINYENQCLKKNEKKWKNIIEKNYWKNILKKKKLRQTSFDFVLNKKK